MTPKCLDFSSEFSKYVPEDRDQRIVETPYGTGVVIRTRKDNVVEQKSNLMHEIELVNWTKLKLESREGVSSSSSSNPPMLYTPLRYPSVSADIGSDVLTKWGKGKVKEIRDDNMKTHVVKLSSWRLANRSSVFCYVSEKECEVIKPKKVYDMDVFEKVEYAKVLKQQATDKFKQKDYVAALELFARAVDAVRYVQHGVDSTNELRADLIVVMITCSNNAALCSSKKDNWGHTAKFGENALVLIEALEEKGNGSKIKAVLNSDGIGDSQLFGTWKVKSLLLIAKSQMEQHDTSKMTNALKKALKAISTYKKENDSMYKQLSTQEKDIRRLRLDFSKKSKVAKEKEKKRARAMFGGEIHENKDSTKIESSTIQDTTRIQKESSLGSISMPKVTSNQHSVGALENASTSETGTGDGKSVATSAKTLAEKEDDDDDDDHSESAFFEEHSEALLLLSGIALGWLVLKMVKRKNAM